MHNEPFILLLIISCLATWRITSIISQEKIFAPIRKFLGEKETTVTLDNGISYSDYEYTTFISNLIGCFWCLSVWVGTFCAVMLFVFPYFLLPFAISAVGIYLQRWQEQIR